MTRIKPRFLIAGAALALLGAGLAGGGWWVVRAAAPAAQDVAPQPVALHNGSCASLDPTPLASLGEVTLGAEAAGSTGGLPTVPVGMATATMDVRLDDLLAAAHAIAAGAGTADPAALAACGEVAGQVTGDGLVVGLRELNGSGYAGIAWLRPDGERTAATVFLAQGLAGPSAAKPARAAVTFHVPTITCPTCPLRVEASVKKAPGVLGVAFDGQDVTVTYDPSQVSPEEIAAAIAAGGDTVEPVEG
jgi:copper chaperone CopZ